MNWLKQHWQLRLLALMLAVFLWLVLHMKSLRMPSPPWEWAPPRQADEVR